MMADLMARLDHRGDARGIGLDGVAGDEPGRRDAVLASSASSARVPTMPKSPRESGVGDVMSREMKGRGVVVVEGQADEMFWHGGVPFANHDAMLPQDCGRAASIRGPCRLAINRECRPACWPSGPCSCS